MILGETFHELCQYILHFPAKVARKYPKKTEYHEDGLEL